MAAGCRVKDPPNLVAIQQEGMPHVAVPGQWTAGATAPPGAVTDNWLQTFGDAQMNALVEEAIAYNTDW
jgi:outer membrane protein TolC